MVPGVCPVVNMTKRSDDGNTKVIPPGAPVTFADLFPVSCVLSSFLLGIPPTAYTQP